MQKRYVLVALGLLCPASAAFASPSYPAAIASELELPCEPECTLCHSRATGGFATVNTPFGLSVRMDEGLTCCDAALLPDVLAELRQKGTDSDGDGADDIEELEALTSPNSEDDVDLDCQAAADDSGCSVRGAVGGTQRSGRAALLVGVALIASARRLRSSGRARHSS